MSVFTEDEVAFLQSKRIGRVATSNAKGDLHVVPLRFKYNAELDVIDLVGATWEAPRSFVMCKPRGVPRSWWTT